MRRAILKKFILVLLAALCINSVIFYLISSHMILKMAREDMTYTIEMIDRLLDYEDESYLAVQIERMEEFTGADDTRVTLIHLDGTVVSDTDTSTEDLDNHLSRKEVKEALLNGMGYAKRYSKTMGKHFLYVAFQSHRSDMILRISVPYSGFSEYLPMLLPAALVSFLAALACAFVFTRRFVDSVTRPLQDIVSELQKVKGGNGELHFSPCPYQELNVIAETTMEMSNNVKDYLNRIEKEKQIRQEFFSNASHELKTPITSIQGYAELMESGMIQDEAMKLDFIRRIKKEASNMAGLIGDILMISRLEAKDAQVVLSECDGSALFWRRSQKA